MAFLLSTKVSSGMALGFRMRYLGEQGNTGEEEARQGSLAEARQRLQGGSQLNKPAGEHGGNGGGRGCV